MAGDWHKERHYNGGMGIYRVTDRRDPKFPDGAFWDLVNMVYDRESDNPEVMRGGTRVGSTAMGGDVTGLFDYNNGSRLVATCEDGKIYEYVSSDWAVVSGARATGNDTTVTTRWAAEMFYGATTTANLLIMGNGVDNLARFDTTNGAVALGGSPPSAATFPTAWQGKLWVATGSIIYYSATNNCEDWTSGGGGGNIVIYRGFDGNVTGLAAFANNLFIFKRSSIYRIAPTGTLSDISIVKNVDMETGCVNHNTIKEAGPEGGKYLTFLSERGVMAIVTSASSAGFSVIPLDRWIKPILDSRNKDRTDVAFAVWNADRKEYWLHYPSGAATLPNDAVISNFAKGRLPPRWTRCNLPNFTSGIVFNEGNTDYVHYLGDTAGKVYQMHVGTATTVDGQPVTGTVKEKFYTQGEPESMKEYGWSFVDIETDGDYSVSVSQQMYRPGLSSSSANVHAPDFSEQDSDWGVGQWGVALWGGSGDRGQRLRPKYVRRASGMSHIINCGRWFRYRGVVIASAIKADNIAA